MLGKDMWTEGQVFQQEVSNEDLAAVASGTDLGGPHGCGESFSQCTESDLFVNEAEGRQWRLDKSEWNRA